MERHAVHLGKVSHSDPHAPHRRFLARPRRFTTGLAVSVGLHAALALLFVVIWSLLPFPPIQPIRVFLLPNAPTRVQIGVDDTGKPGWSVDSSGAPTLPSAP